MTVTETKMDSDLPDVLPLFPLLGGVLLPRARLPLNVYEPRSIEMVQFALGHGRLLGMVQPSKAPSGDGPPSLYQVGCCGKIISFSETDDGRFLISLQGISRFKIVEELSLSSAFRVAKPDWTPFMRDRTPEEGGTFDRANLIAVLKSYFKNMGISADWNAIQGTSDEMLVSSLTMICPLEPNEKQAIVEATDLRARAEMLTALLEMAAVPASDAETARH